MYLTKVVEKMKTHIFRSTTFPKIVLYTRQCGKSVQPDRPQIIIWHMHIAYWIPKAINTNSRECNNYWFSTATMVAWIHFSVMLYVLCLLVSFEVNSLDLSFTGFHYTFTEYWPEVRQKLKHVKCTIHIDTEPTSI
jgi:hypothetical protein